MFLVLAIKAYFKSLMFAYKILSSSIDVFIFTGLDLVFNFFSIFMYKMNVLAPLNKSSVLRFVSSRRNVTRMWTKNDQFMSTMIADMSENPLSR